MILLDFSGTLIASIMANIYANENFVIDEDHFRSSVLHSIRKYKMKFSQEYGDLIIACDGKDYWRKKQFPYYKIKRKKDHDKSIFDWKLIYTYVEKIKNEIKNNLPYPVVEVNEAEADDVIASLVSLNQEKIRLNVSKILIISRDKDLKQLQKYDNINQFNPIDNRWEICDDPHNFLLEHIIKGDTGDSIPNIFSPQNCIAIGQRQIPATKKKIEEFKKSLSSQRFFENKKLIDFDYIPDYVHEKIIQELNNQINKKKKDVVSYFLSHNLDSLAMSVQDFI